jgi:hypothetical protein
MSANEWDDFDAPKTKQTKETKADSPLDRTSPDGGCDWGQANGAEESLSNDCRPTKSSATLKFIELYEAYLNDKKSLTQQTSNHKVYSKNAQKELRDWFENEGHEFQLNVDQCAPGQFVCSIDLPIEDQDFTLTSEIHSKRAAAIEEVCLDACRMLDSCELLCAGQSGDKISHEEELARKRRITEASKEDDIVFDRTTDTKRHCYSNDPLDLGSSSANKASGNRVYTYDSLMAQWTAVNMSILQSKAKLVKLDLSVAAPKQKRATTSSATSDKGCEVRSESPRSDNGDEEVEETQIGDEDEVDPLEEFMSSLETKTKLTMDEKIEKSRLKAEITKLEQQQEELAKLIGVTRPSFDSSKMTPSGVAGRRN